MAWVSLNVPQVISRRAKAEGRSRFSAPHRPTPFAVYVRSRRRLHHGSFGMVCFEIATRQYPFRGMSEPQVVYEVMIRGSRPDFPNFPLEKEVVGLMEQCWQKDPAHRPDSFHSVAERLEALLSSAGGDPRKSGDLPKGASSNIDARASMLRKENNPLMWISRQSSLISDSSGGAYSVGTTFFSSLFPHVFVSSKCHEAFCPETLCR